MLQMFVIQQCILTILCEISVVILENCLSQKILSPKWPTTYQVRVTRRGHTSVSILHIDSGVVRIPSPSVVPDLMVGVPQGIEADTQVRGEVIVEFELVSVEFSLVVEYFVTVHIIVSTVRHFVIVAGIHFGITYFISLHKLEAPKCEVKLGIV